MAGRGVLPPGDGSHQGRPAASGSFRQNAISGSFRQNPSFVMAGLDPAIHDEAQRVQS